MKSSSVFWLVFLGAGFLVAGGDLVYELGRDSALRECPTVQSGQHLLNSEQRQDGTMCVYASEASAYVLAQETRRP
jgi:hypothetical protein